MAGWEPETVTTYSYDVRGRLVEARTVTEPEWSDDDRAWTYALELVEARACAGCGRPQSEVWGEHQHRPDLGHKLCVACWTAADVVERVVKERPSVPQSAVKIVTAKD